MRSTIIAALVAAAILVVPPIYRGLALGEAVEQNQLSLVLRAVGDRSAETANRDSAELVTAARGPGPLEVGVVELKFPLGLNAFEFSERQSFDSAANEQIVCDSQGGPVTFDVVVHVHIDETFPDITDRLLRFAEAYSLRQYNASPDVLVELVRGPRMRDVIREPFVSWCASRSALQIMNGKAEINRIAREHMNNEFNQYGLRFTLVSVSSAMRVSDAQQERLNGLVTQSTDTRIRNRRSDELLPVRQAAADIRNTGANSAQAKIDEAELKAAKIRAAAEKAQREALVKLVGAKAFAFLQTTVAPLEAMAKGGTVITIVPTDARIYLGQPTDMKE